MEMSNVHSILVQVKQLGASYPVIRERSHCFLVDNDKRSLNPFKHRAKDLSETAEPDITKHKEIILTPPHNKQTKIPEYFHYQLATVTTKKLFMDLTESFFPSRIKSSWVCQMAYQ